MCIKQSLLLLPLVYCLTVPSIGMGQIFTIGGTAALAWELPHTPYKPLKKSNEDANKRVDKLSVSTSGGWSLLQDKIRHTTTNIDGDKYKKIYYKTIENPYENTWKPFNNWTTATSNSNNYHTINYLPKWKSSNNKNYYDDYYSNYHYVHRRTRRDLYGKIQKFLTA